MQNNNNNLEDKIICEARRLFVEKGYAGTSMCEIAEASGMTRSALHYYFHTKDKLFQAVFTSILGSFIPHIEEIMTADTPIGERMANLVDTYVEKLQENPSLPLFLIREANRDPENLIAAVTSMGMKQYFLRISKYIQAEMDAGKLKPVPMQVLVFTFYGQLLVPFVFRGVAMPVLTSEDKDYAAVLAEWKPYLVAQMEQLLLPD